ncbi:MAG: hypothetical protein JNM25_09945 [Planctomycetes bacterium]|nr:hypothetical protein [Planctomycetota bacterium]
MLLRPIVFGPILLVLLAFAAMVWRWQQDRSAAAAAREQLVSQVLSATTRAEPDPQELSHLATLLSKYPDHESAPDLLAAGARIELARNRPERARALFGARAANPASTPAEQGLGAEILLRVQAAGVSDASAATGMLRQAQGYAERAFEASGDPDDLLRAWQAASRLQDRAAVARLTQRLEEVGAESPAARLAQLAAQFDPSLPLARVDALRSAFASPPPELAAMHVLLLLQSGDVRGASLAAEALLLRAPGVLAVRWAAALVFHACALGQPEGSGERARWVDRRNSQLDWLLQYAPADDSRRPQWDTMRSSR